MNSFRKVLNDIISQGKPGEQAQGAVEDSWKGMGAGVVDSPGLVVSNGNGLVGERKVGVIHGSGLEGVAIPGNIGVSEKAGTIGRAGVSSEVIEENDNGLVGGGEIGKGGMNEAVGVNGPIGVGVLNGGGVPYRERMREVHERKPGLTPYELYRESFERPELDDGDRKRMESQRKLGLITDLALLFGEGVTGSMGSDINKRDRTVTGMVSENEMRVLDHYRKRRDNYDMGAYQARLAGYKGLRDEAARREQLDYKRWKDGLDMGKWSTEMKLKDAELGRKIKAGELSAKQAEEKFKESVRHNKVMEGIGRDKAGTYRMNVTKKGGGRAGSEYKGTFSFIDEGNRVVNLRFRDKDFFDATTLKALSMMRDEAIAKGDRATINEINLIYNSPESVNQAISYVGQNLGSYPEVADYVVSQSIENTGSGETLKRKTIEGFSSGGDKSGKKKIPGF